MTVTVHPVPGTIVRVDLSQGFREPEMVKRRPAIVLSAALPGRSQLCSIVPLSTPAPRIVRRWHHRIELRDPLPAPYDNPVMWAKCDMVLTVAFHRLRLLHKGKKPDGSRDYDVRILPGDEMEAVRNCVREALGL
jgi:uncharacterized protein YifN (PemK superfamily)